MTRQHVCPLPDKSLLVQAANGPIYEASPAAIMGAGDRESTLGLFKNAGLIANGRTNITILDAAALQATACECYAVVKERYKVLLPMTQ